MKESFAKSSGAPFGNGVGLSVERTELEGRRIDPGESDESLLAVKSGNVADFRNELRAENVSDAEEIHNEGVFREFCGKPIHLFGKDSKSFGKRIELSDGLRN